VVLFNDNERKIWPVRLGRSSLVYSRSGSWCNLWTTKARVTSMDKSASSNFITQIIEQDLRDNTHGGKVVTRFPPEPNGYLHIGHARSIWLNFGLALRYGGLCNLRFDDTNPEKEEQQFVDSIKEDVQWLGYQWSGEVRYASDYFDQFYQWARFLVGEGKAYVCDLTAEQASEYRGWATRPGKESPYRNRSVDENLKLLEQMRLGEFDEGARVLRAKIDMASPNMNMRDPILYRIRKVSHHQTGDKWCIYPSYDFAHGQEDAIEGVTHSICTLEFQDHRPLYDWFIDNLPVPCRPRQYEFGRLNLSYTVTSKRKLKLLVEGGYVDGWDDPRMPTIAGMRRRGYTAGSLRKFCDMVPVSRSDALINLGVLEHAIRDELNEQATRVMCVLDPLKIELTNYHGERTEWLSAAAHPNKPDLGARKLPFTRELYIDRADFSEDVSLSRKKFKRLVLGEWVRLRSAYIIKADEVVKDANGVLICVKASIVENTVGNDAPQGIRPRGVIHWVSATLGLDAEVRLYDRLFTRADPDKGEGDFTDLINPASLKVARAVIEPSVVNAAPETHYQFEREGYFVTDRYHHHKDKPVYNRTVGLRDTWESKL